MTLEKWIGDAENIAVVGGGGKTTLLCRMAETGIRPLILTTTTRVQRPFPLKNLQIHDSPGYPDRTQTARVPVLWVNGRNAAGDKWLAPPAEEMERLLARPGDRRVVIEADGSKGRPIKAPGPGEPVIPGNTSLVIAVIGMAGFGRIADESTVHRIERYSDLTGAPTGSRIEEASLISLLGHPAGIFSGAPLKARRLVLLNQVDGAVNTDGLANTDTGDGPAARLGSSILREIPAVDSVALASLGHNPLIRVMI